MESDADVNLVRRYGHEPIKQNWSKVMASFLTLHQGPPSYNYAFNVFASAIASGSGSCLRNFVCDHSFTDDIVLMCSLGSMDDSQQLQVKFEGDVLF